MLKTYDFECLDCGQTFEDIVEGEKGLPEQCPHCSSTSGFKKVIGTFSYPTTIVVDYPGSKAHKAGYVHLFNRPAEKKDSQISMHGAYKK
jgi:putative FmdB family regulatory protein